MKNLTLLVLLVCFALLNTYSQTIELTFTAVENAEWVQLNNIKVMNRTQGIDTVLYWPYTVLVLDYEVGIPDINNNIGVLKVFQNYPNPVVDQTKISLYVPEKDQVSIIITDMLGRVIVNNERVLEKGYHFFRFTPGSGSLFFFAAHLKGKSSSIKILHQAFHENRISLLEYLGSDLSSAQLKETEAIQSFSYSPGDTLLYIGYTDTHESGILDTPETSQTYTFQFAMNIPCPGTSTVTYEGQVYNTVQIFSQCWLKENLNVGTMIPGASAMTDNDTIEKYCYNDEPDSCAKYGGLYQWYEMMQYTTQQGTQGICPPGWHIPTDEEWIVLEGAVDSQYGIGDPEWKSWGSRGYDAGTNLKTNSGWYDNGNGTDLFGFSALPGGYRNYYGRFYNLGFSGYWWSATEGDSSFAWSRYLGYGYDGVSRDTIGFKGIGFSVRCVRD